MSSRKDNIVLAGLVEAMPGGVNSPVRSFAGAGSSKPVIIRSASGACVYDQYRNEYVDYIHGWGSIAVGHSNVSISADIGRAASDGLCFGTSSPQELKFANALRKAFDLQKVRLVCSGTEAAMSALRLARGCTGRDLFVKFAGCYHGHADCLLVAAGSGGLTFGKPSSAGVPAQATADTLVLPYNDPQALRDAFAEHGESIAAVIMEPIAGNMNLVVPDREFVAEARQQCNRADSLLIADEVMSGMRACEGLACRDIFGIEPDLVCLGKIIGGGLPLAAFGGRAELMDQLAPLGDVYQAGTLSGNPVAIAAGLSQMNQLAERGAHGRLAATTAILAEAFRQAAQTAGVPATAQSVGGMFGLYFAPEVPRNLAEVQACDLRAFCTFHAAVLDAGVLLPPSMFEAAFVGLSHSPDEINRTVDAFRAGFQAVAA